MQCPKKPFVAFLSHSGSVLGNNDWTILSFLDLTHMLHTRFRVCVEDVQVGHDCRWNGKHFFFTLFHLSSPRHDVTWCPGRNSQRNEWCKSKLNEQTCSLQLSDSVYLWTCCVWQVVLRLAGPLPENNCKSLVWVKNLGQTWQESDETSLFLAFSHWVDDDPPPPPQKTWRGAPCS